MSSSSPNRVQQLTSTHSTTTSSRELTLPPTTGKVVVVGGSSCYGGDPHQNHSDSGIENCNSSDASNCHTTDHDREEDATTATTLTTNRGIDDCSSSGSEDNGDDLDSRRNLIADELADYEIVESTEEVKVSEEATRAKAHHHTSHNSPSVVVEAKRIDNKIATSKEEKQRQNEEIIILESSSVSSETGSWESVSPEQLQQLQQVVSTTTDVLAAPQATAPAAAAGNSSSVAYSSKFSNYDAKPIRTACFIDASSLLDDSELAALNAQNGGGGGAEGSCDRRERMDKEDEPKILTETKNIDYEIKDQFSSGEFTPLQMSGGGLVGSTGSSGSAGEAQGGRKSSSPPKNPQESERLQGHLVFKNAINQYSGVLIEDPEPLIEVRDEFPEADCGTSAPIRSYPLRNARSDFNSLLDIYQENKKNSGNKFNYMRTQSENHAEQQSIVLPDTPHNSILNVNLIQADDRKRFESSESIDGPCTPKRHLKYMESAPIVSGGVSVADFSPKLWDSPPVRRKLDTCPILSGGFVTEPKSDNEEMEKAIKPAQSSSSSSWVIDLNDLPQAEAEQPEEKEKPIKMASQSAPAKKFSGFYVSLDDVAPVLAGSASATESVASSDNETTATKRPVAIQSSGSSSSMKKSTGFFVDMSMAKEEPVAAKSANQVTMERMSSEERTKAEEDKKNMFSMFIDFGEKKPVPRKDSLNFTSKLAESINRRKELERRSESPKTSTERVAGEAEKCSSLTFVPLEKREEVQLRPKFRQSLSEDKRHTWADRAGVHNVAKSDGQAAGPAERPISFTAGDQGLMSIIDKIPLLSKTSSMSIDSSISPLEDFTCSKSELSTFSTSATSNSNNSSTKELNQQLKILGSAEKKHRKDAKINETFDKSSQSSITDGALLKDLSPDSTATNTDDVTYQNEPASQDEQSLTNSGDTENLKGKLMETSNNLETILEANEKLASPAKKLAKIEPPKTVQDDEKLSTAATLEATHTMETLQATIEKQRKLLLETVNETAETTSFVRLSDMDKPYQSFEIYASSGGQQSLTRSERRSRSTASHDLLGVQGNYYEKARHNNMYYSTDTNIINLASSFENSRSLSRIFPHLSKVFSSSVPTNVGMENSQPSELTSMSSDLSAISSVTSSCNRSAQDSGDETSIFCRQPRRLGEDLLKMFLHEIGTDVTIDIGHRKLKAHKCILQSRCQYFAAILAGGWVHNAGNVISLPGYSYEAVHFALCHIYSGASHPPEGISLMELAAIADLLGLVGLREVTAYALKVNYCHNFHKPCLGCIEGILQVLPVALNHGLDDLYRKCLKWTCKHYLKIWPTRTFASLSSDLRHRCQQLIIAHLCSENVLTTILDCENLLAVVAPLRWGAAVENILHEISDTAQIYLSEHFSSLVASDSFLSLGHDQSGNIPALENLLLRSASTLSPDQACRSYQRVTKLHQVLHSKILTQQQNKIRAIVGADLDEDLDWDVDFIRLVSAILSSVEQCLQRQCSRAMRTSAWQRLDLELRKKIQKLACLTDPLFERRQKANARQQQQKQPVYQASYNRNQDIQQVRLAIHAHSKRSAQGYIIDQFTNNNNNHHGGGGGGGGGGHNQYKSHSTHTQTHLNNNEGRGGSGHYNREKRDKSVQASHEIAKSGTRSNIQNGAVKLEKSKSHSAVNTNGSSSSAAMTNNRRSVAVAPGVAAGEQRQSRELQRNATTSHVGNSSSNGVNGGKMRTDVQSRYLDISKKSQRVAQPANEAVRHVKQSEQQFSSSGTSTRTPSPLVNRKAQPKNVEAHMSLDSLASPKKQPLGNQQRGVLAVHHDENSLSRDSLADSIRSSIRTEGTISQESLAHTTRNRLSVVDQKVGTKNVKNSQKSMNGGGGSTSGSTSSVGATQKNGGGRLMRNFSDSGVVFRNPGNASKGLSSNSNSSNASTRTSFLSKKSKEILERRSMNQQHERTSEHQQNGGVRKGEEMRRSLPINKSSSTSNIPTNRRIFNTTLHLRKTAHLVIPEKPSVTAQTNSSLARSAQVGLKPSRIAQKIQPSARNGKEIKLPVKKQEKSERDLMVTEKAFEVLGLNNCGDSMDGGYEAKMVRSSTFSKDCPDLSLSLEIS